MKVRRSQNNISIQIGNTCGADRMYKLQYFYGVGFRLTICYNSDKLISKYGYNQRTYGV